MVTSFEKLGPEDATKPRHGAAKAWLAHIDMLKFVMQSGYTTALIVEDDVDWDMRIKEQLSTVAPYVRNITDADEDHEDDPAWFSHVTAAEPYGRNWDVLWIGHCGEYWDPNIQPTISFIDSTAPSHAQYLGWTKQYVERLPDNSRSVYPSFNPVCTFAYAVNGASIPKILNYVSHGESEAFDIRLMGGCKGRHISCVSVNPELMHQYFPPAKYGVGSEVDVGNGQVRGPDDEAFEGEMGSTENILQSARCMALFGRECLSRP